MLSIATALQGTCTFGAASHTVRVIDGTHSLQPGHAFPSGTAAPSKGFPGGDTLLVDVGDGTFNNTVRACYGNPVLVDGVWYQVALTPDGQGLAATPCPDATATITLNREHWHALLVGTKYLLDLTGGADQLNVPADQYRVFLLSDSAMPNATGSAAMLDAMSYTGNGKPYRLTAGSNIALTPVQATVAGVQVDAAGSNIAFSLAGAIAADSVPFAVYDACGNCVYSNSFEHGEGGFCPRSWRAPAGMKGTFYVRITARNLDPFTTMTRESQFTIE